MDRSCMNFYKPNSLPESSQDDNETVPPESSQHGNEAILLEFSAIPCEWVCQTDKMHLKYKTQINEAILNSRTVDIKNKSDQEENYPENENDPKENDSFELNCFHDEVKVDDSVAQLLPLYSMPKLSQREKRKEISYRLVQLIEHGYSISFLEEELKKYTVPTDDVWLEFVSLMASNKLKEQISNPKEKDSDITCSALDSDDTEYCEIIAINQVPVQPKIIPNHSAADIEFRRQSFSIPEVIEFVNKNLDVYEKPNENVVELLQDLQKKLDDLSELFSKRAHLSVNSEESAKRNFSYCLQELSKIKDKTLDAYSKENKTIHSLLIDFLNKHLKDSINKTYSVIKGGDSSESNIKQVMKSASECTTTTLELHKDFHKNKGNTFEENLENERAITPICVATTSGTPIKENMNYAGCSESRFATAKVSEPEKNIVDSALNYFLYFQQAVLKDCELSEYLFTALVMHLKKSASNFTDICPFLLLLIFTQYRSQNVSNLSKFLTICKLFYNRNFNFGKGHIEKLRQFLLFCMFHNYEKENNESNLLRKAAAAFYSDVVKKHCRENLVKNLVIMQEVLKDPNSEFYSCYSALIAVKATSLSAMAKIIPEVFEILGKNVSYVYNLAVMGKNSREVTYVSRKSKKKSKKRKRSDISEETGSEVCKRKKDSVELRRKNKPRRDIYVQPYVEQSESSMDYTKPLRSEKNHENELSNGKHVDSNETNESFDLSIRDDVKTIIRILSENKYASLLMSELLDACIQLSNNFIKHTLNMEDRVLDPFFNTCLLPIKSASVEKFVNYFGYELLHKLHLPTVHCVYKTMRKNNRNAFTQKLISELQLIAKSRFH